MVFCLEEDFTECCTLNGDDAGMDGGFSGGREMERVCVDADCTVIWIVGRNWETQFDVKLGKQFRVCGLGLGF